MGVNVLSGVLETRLCPTGQAKIDLDTNRIASGPDGLSLARSRIVGSSRYSSIPCRMVALREIKISEMEGGGEPRYRVQYETDYLRISDVSIDEHYWESKGSDILEISYMVIGEVP